jgi:hypothetical protein
LADEVEPRGLISAEDASLFTVTDDVDVAARELLGFYRNYQSCRWVGDLLVIRLLAAPTPRELDDLNRRFADIVSDGVIRTAKPFPPERASADHLDLPRLAFRMDKMHYGRLRQMIDQINQFAATP